MPLTRSYHVSPIIIHKSEKQEDLDHSGIIIGADKSLARPD